MLRTSRRWTVCACSATVLALGVMGAVAASGASAQTVWLCRPGVTPDPCAAGLSTTVFTPSETKIKVTQPQAVKNPNIDCFYVYPTVSDQTTTNATLSIDPEEDSIALEQAARYSQYCKVYAPMYPQITIPGLEATQTTPPTPVAAAAAALAYSGVLAAWKDYLAHDNDGRGFALIGHSQGSEMLIRLISQQIDPNAALRKRLVSAIILGGNLQVKKGSDVGGDFQHIPGCKSATQLGCVIAWSTFDQTPPSDPLFGIADPVLSSLSGFSGPSGPAYQVLCTNPAALGGGSGLLDPINAEAPFAPGTALGTLITLLKDPPPPATTTFVEAPGSYTAQCSTAGGVDVLQITPRDGAPTPTPSPLPTWGLHLLDGQIALGNLIGIVHSEAQAYAKQKQKPHK